MMAARVTPWWEALQLRDELLDQSGAIGDIQMSLRGVAYGLGGEYPPYREPEYFGEITYPAPSLVRIAADLAVRLAGKGGQAGSAKTVWRFDQGMGGGKSHALVALWHMASNPVAFAATEIGQAVFDEARALVGTGTVSSDLDEPLVVALPGDQMDPDRPDAVIFGGARSLWERFLFRLYQGDHDRWAKDKDTISYEEALKNAGRPVLILFDEVMHYVRRVTAAGATEQAVKDQAFIIEMMRDTAQVPNCAAVLVMIDSRNDPIALTEFGEQCREELEEEAKRGVVYTDAVTSPNDFAEIIRRRLFKGPPDPEVVATTADRFVEVMADAAWRKEVFGRLRWADPDDFRASVARSYPFHPALIHLAEQEWSQVAGFQRVRSTIRMFAGAVYAHLARLAFSADSTVKEATALGFRDVADWAPLLIGPGDLVLSHADSREALLDSGLIIDDTTLQNYRQVIATDIVDEDDTSGNARRIDLEKEGDPAWAANPRAAERMATATLLYSVNDRPQGVQGASEPEVLAAGFVPDLSFGFGDGEVALTLLKDPDVGLASLEIVPGKGGQPPRLFLSTKKTFGMFLRDAKNSVSDEEREAELVRRAEGLATSGPFARVVPVERPTDDATPRETINAAAIDEARKTRLVVLDPRVFTLLNGSDTETRDVLKAAMGIGTQKLPVNWASSAVFAVANMYRRRNALIAAGDYLAARRVEQRDAVRSDPDLRAQAEEELSRAKRELEKQVRAMYQHVVWLGDDGEGGRAWHEHRFEGDLETALNGTHVWKVLQERGKAFGPGEFNAQALLHNLRDSDLGSKPLSELRDDFWRTPRLPLLPDGERDLRSAIWSAVQSGALVIVDKDGERREAYGPEDINLASDLQRLTRPAEDEGAEEAAGEEEPTEVEGDGKPGVTEKRVAISGTMALNSGNRGSVRVALDALRNAIDEGEASWIQLSINTVVEHAAATDIEEKAKAAGFNPSVTEI